MRMKTLTVILSAVLIAGAAHAGGPTTLNAPPMYAGKENVPSTLPANERATIATQNAANNSRSQFTRPQGPSSSYARRVYMMYKR